MTTDVEDIRARIKRLIVERLFIEGLEPAEIRDDAALGVELGLDSVDVLELMLGLEQEFGLKIADNGFEREAFESVGSLAEFVRGSLEKPRG